MTTERTKEDVISLAIGDFGRFQALICLFHSFTCFLFIWQIFANKFLAGDVGFSCASADGDQLSSNFTTVASFKWTCLKVEDEEIVRCDEFDFSHATYQNTVVERFGLACSDSKPHLLRLAQSLFFVGTLMGALTCGPVSDRYGRKTVYVISVGLCGMSSAISLLASSFPVWVLGRMLAGMFSMAVTLSSNVYRTEVFGGRWRSLGNAIGAAVPAQLGHMFMALYVYLVPDLKWLEVILATSGLACIPFWFLIPESPRWLKVQGRKRKAMKVITKISKMNGLYEQHRTMIREEYLHEEDVQEKLKIDEDEKFKTRIVTKYPALRRNLFICAVLWFCFNVGFYGMVYNTPPLDFSPQLVFAFPAFFTLPMVVVSPFLENCLGRKALIFFPLCLGGVTAVLTMAFPNEWNWLIITLCTISTVMAFMALNVSYTYTKEIFPTVMRGTALSFSSTFGRLGAISAPLLMYLIPVSASSNSPLQRLPLAAYGLCMIVAGVSSLWLWPETAWMVVPDSLEEGEAAASSRNSWISWCSLRRKPKDNQVIAEKSDETFDMLKTAKHV